MNPMILACLFVLSSAALALFAAPPSQEGAPQGPPRPTSHHKHLAAQVGTWDAAVEMMGAASKGTETCQLVGGFWLVTDFQGEMMGAPFHGHGLMGHDPSKQKYVGVWADSMTPVLARLEGTASEDGKTLTCWSEGPDMEGKLTRFKHVTRIAGEKSRSYAISAVGKDGREEAQLKIQYTRRG